MQEKIITNVACLEIMKDLTELRCLLIAHELPQGTMCKKNLTNKTQNPKGPSSI